ncbi:hypothetical protein ACP70R_022683 [Stipagrostis hirtigluma subsp. patula]
MVQDMGTLSDRIRSVFIPTEEGPTHRSTTIPPGRDGARRSGPQVPPRFPDRPLAASTMEQPDNEPGGAPAMPLDAVFEILLRLPAKDLPPPCRLPAVRGAHSSRSRTSSPHTLPATRSRSSPSATRQPVYPMASFATSWTSPVAWLSRSV